MDGSRYQPSYRLSSKNPYNREICENILKKLVDKEMLNFQYKPDEVHLTCNKLCEEIKSAVKSSKFDRYRIICVVTLGEKYMRDFQAMVSFLWDAEKDGYATYVHETPDMFLIATIYAVYYE